MTDKSTTAAPSTSRSWGDRATPWRTWRTQWDAQTAEATKLIVEAAGMTASLHVLDVACGPGQPALTIAALVGIDGHVTATDASAAMVDIAQDEAQARGLHNITFGVAPAAHIPASDATFDAVTCRFGIAHVDDPDMALREALRVLRPGGVAAFVVWGPAARNPFFTIVDDAIARHAPTSPPVERERGPFTFAAPGTLSDLLTRVGFVGVAEGACSITLSWPGSPEEAWAGRRAMSGSSAARLDALPLAVQDMVTDEILAAYRAREDAGTVRLPAVVNVVSGFKPSL